MDLSLSHIAEYMLWLVLILYLNRFINISTVNNISFSVQLRTLRYMVPALRAPLYLVSLQIDILLTAVDFKKGIVNDGIVRFACTLQ